MESKEAEVARRNVEIVNGLYKAFRERDNEAPFAFYDEEIEFDVSRMPEAMGTDMIDITGVYKGHDELRGFWRQWLMAWETVEFEQGESEPIGDCVVVGPIRQRMRGRASGIEVPFPDWWQVWWLQDGRVTRAVQYFDRADALRAAQAD